MQLALLAGGRLDHHGDTAERGIVEQAFEKGRADSSAAEVGVAVPARAAGTARVVEVEAAHSEHPEALGDLRREVPVAGLLVDRVAGGEGVADVDADAEPEAALRQLADPRPLLEAMRASSARLPRMLPRLLRGLALAVYSALLLGIFGASAYVSFSLFVRSGSTQAPDVVGLPEGEAVSVLADQGFRLTRADNPEAYDEAVPAGHILRQSPRAGSLVKRGSEVKVVVSSGQEMVEVPELAGSVLQAAQVALAAAGLRIGRTASVYAAAASPGTVVDQVPQPGSRVGRASAVDLFLCLESFGETYLMPDLVYRRYEEVRRFFESRGLRFGSVKFEPYEGVAAGTVLRQFPLAGHPLRRRDTISLVVAAE